MTSQPLRNFWRETAALSYITWPQNNQWERTLFGKKSSYLTTLRIFFLYPWFPDCVTHTSAPTFSSWYQNREREKAQVLDWIKFCNIINRRLVWKVSLNTTKKKLNFIYSFTKCKLFILPNSLGLTINNLSFLRCRKEKKIFLDKLKL